ncbi:MAG: hypothetical protein ACLQVG_30230, partial [Terriglobia bacterium]
PETKDPVLFHQPTRKSVGYYGAVRLRDGRFLFRRDPHATARTVLLKMHFVHGPEINCGVEA